MQTVKEQKGNSQEKYLGLIKYGANLQLEVLLCVERVRVFVKKKKVNVTEYFSPVEKNILWLIHFYTWHSKRKHC